MNDGSRNQLEGKNSASVLVSLGFRVRRYLGILRALFRQEEQSRRQAPMESFMNLMEPIILITTLSFLFYFLGRKQISPLGGSPVLFYATGFFPMYFFIYISKRMRGSIDGPGRRFPVEQRLDHIIVHIVLRIIDYSILGIILFGGIYFLFSPNARPNDVAPIFLSCVTLVGLGFGWGIFIMLVSRISPILRPFLHGVSRTLMLFSGVFFVPDFLSPGVRYVLSFNPLLHAIALFRTGFYPHYPTLIMDVTYLVYISVFVLLMGLVVERVTRRSEGR